MAYWNSPAAGALVALQADTPSIGGAGRYARIVTDMAMLRASYRRWPTGGGDGVLAARRRRGGRGPGRDHGPRGGPLEVVGHRGQFRRPAGRGHRRPRSPLRIGWGHLRAAYRAFATWTRCCRGCNRVTSWCWGPGPRWGSQRSPWTWCAHVAFRAGRPVLLFSLEMSKEQLADRFIAAEAKVNLQHLRNGRLDETEWSRISSAIARIGASPLYIDHKRDIGVAEIRAKARRVRAQLGDLALVVVDYLQLMHSDAGSRPENRQIEVAGISRGLKVLAGELGVPVLALSSLSRNLEARADKRPNLSDLRESGRVGGRRRCGLFPLPRRVVQPGQLRSRHCRSDRSEAAQWPDRVRQTGVLRALRALRVRWPTEELAAQSPWNV